MKKINKKAKRVLCLAIAFALLIGTIFTSNVGTNINANAETQKAVSAGKTVYLTSTNKKNISDLTIASFSTDKAGNYIIDTAEKLAFVCTFISPADSYGKTFKVADDIDAFVLQTESYASGIKDLSDAAAVKEYFESNESGRYNWMETYLSNGINGVFNGTFDGNGVVIYGLYSQSLTKKENGLFPMVDGGGPIGTSAAPTVDTTGGTTLKNFALRNSYITGYSTMGAIIGGTMYNQASAYCDGFVTIDGCEISNCYLYVDDSLTSTTANKAGTFRIGVMAGNSEQDPIKANNCLVYNNKYDGNLYDKSTATHTFYEDISMRLFGYNKHKDVGGVTIRGEVNNSVLINVGLSGTEVANFTNTFTNVNENYFPNLVTYIENADDFKGSIGKTYLGAFNWATDETAGNGTVQWYARENDMPTLVMPAGWKDTVKGYSVWSGPNVDLTTINFAGGTGTKEAPFIIKTADQLWKMVKTQSYSKKYDEVAGQTGAEAANYDPFYYKVADGVDALYLNNIFKNPTYSALETLINGGKYKNWVTGDYFYGNFDGNGVTIYGLASTSRDNEVGFVSGLDGSNVAIKNVNFKASYIKNSNKHRAAVITSNLRNFQYTYGDVTFDHKANIDISNVSVTETGIFSYIERATSEPQVFSTYESVGGLVSFEETPDIIAITNCLYDGSNGILETVTSRDTSVHSIAGIASFRTNCNNVTIYNCVSIGAPLVPMVTSTALSNDTSLSSSYTRYTTGGGNIVIKNCYSPVNAALVSAERDYSVIKNGVTAITKLSGFTEAELPNLDWVNHWSLVDGKPMPKVAPATPDLGMYADYTTYLAYYRNYGLNSSQYPYRDGNYPWVHELKGSGTEDDPYIIDSAQRLAIAIATGGKNLDNKLYYKLACDINLGALPWLEIDKVLPERYRYIPFEGVLDGDGHIVSGLSCIGGDYSGLIPELTGGVVKNLHMRSSYVLSNDTEAGIIAGRVSSGSTISGCSVEGSRATATKTNLITGIGWSITNSYMIKEDAQNADYILNDGTAIKPITNGTVNSANVQTILNDSDNWYLGGGEKALPRLKNFAVAHTTADIDGDGVASDYTTNDLAALRQKLLNNPAYANIFGDVSSNGVTNISDLAILRREMIGTYNEIDDGFWRNVELGKVKIYYAENDTQDMARKVELYLEGLYPEVDIVKVADTAVTDKTVTNVAKYNGEPNAIVITKASADQINDENHGQFDIAYNDNNVVDIYGYSFTAVEAAVNEFIANADPQNNIVVPGNRIIGKIAKEKQRKTVEIASGKTVEVYYAWGDEFNDNKATTVERDSWTARPYHNEGDSRNNIDAGTADASGTRHFNMEGPNVENLESLWEVNNGKLKIWRGINTDVYTGAASTYSWGYKGVAAGAPSADKNDFGSIIDNQDIYIDSGMITTENTMLFKQGYAEMRGSLPNDGHSFPAWWFMTGRTFDRNSKFAPSLYEKVYKRNSGYDGVSDKLDVTNPSTYKYKTPMSYLEFDIIEFLQPTDGLYNTTGNYIDHIQFTIHKYYSGINAEDDKLYIYDWAQGKYLNLNGNVVSGALGISREDFVNTSNSATAFVHKYSPNNIEYLYGENGTGRGCRSSYSVAEAVRKGKLSSSAKVQDTYTYGFYWNVDESNSKYNLIVYVDFDNNNTMAYNERIFSINQDCGHQPNDSTFTDPIYGKSYEYDTWNQYAYMLLDNSFYTSNPTGANTGVAMHTDLLDSNSGTDKTTFDIEYVRVYQENGRRDIITPDTEFFNTDDHFGYGSND